MNPYTTLIRFLIAWLAFAALSAHAFDEDGYRTGMTVKEVEETLPKNHMLHTLGNKWEVYFIMPRDKKLWSDPKSLLNEDYFTFCRGLLMSFTKILNFDTEYLPKLKELLARYGKPSSIKVDDSTFEGQASQSMEIMWWVDPDKVSISFRQDKQADRKKKTLPPRSYLEFSTPDTLCWDIDVPARRPWQLPPPFGTIG
ncbi:MAG: hypothetical protein IPH73_11335 [Rhodocyclales bacterium]|nr:hypothetical protein [Rhodocyclales bacterium]